jgi:HEAT repeat protein
MALHLLRAPATGKPVEQMLGDARLPFRRTAACLMGRIAQPEFAVRLEQATGDEDPGVREAATGGLEVFRKSELPPALS